MTVVCHLRVFSINLRKPKTPEVSRSIRAGKCVELLVHFSLDIFIKFIQYKLLLSFKFVNK